MGVLTFATMREMVKFQFANNTEFEAVGSSATNYYGLWINRAYNQLTTTDKIFGIRKRLYFPQLDTSTSSATVDGQAYISVPTDALIIKHIYDETNDKYLTQISNPDYLRKTDRSNTSAEGKPSYWTRMGSYIYLHQTPDTAYALTVYYRRIPTALAADGAVTVLGDEWDHIIVQFAVYIGQMWVGDERAKITREDLIDRIANLVDIYYQEQKSKVEYIHLDEVYNDFSY